VGLARSHESAIVAEVFALYFVDHHRSIDLPLWLL